MGKRLPDSEQNEKYIEKYLCAQVKELGGIPYKFTSPQRRSVPDRMLIFPGPLTVFVECKRPGKKPTPLQDRELNLLRDMNFWAEWVDTIGGIDDLIARIKMELEEIQLTYSL